VRDASRTGRARWVALDRNAVQIDSDVEAIAKGATGWGRPEDIEIIPNVSIKGRRHDVMYVSSTSEALVLRIVLDGAEASVDNFLKEGVNITGLNDPDNLELDEVGNLYVVEDNGPSDVWLVPTGRGLLPQATSAGRWVSLSDCSAELTGLYFDRTNPRRAWVNVQHAGGALSNDLTLEITRPRN
jgi:secreted PhoX family phosphatase